MILLISCISALSAFFFVLFFFLALQRVRSTDLFYRLRRHYQQRSLLDDGDTFINKLFQNIKKVAKPLASLNLAKFFDIRLRQAAIPILGSEFLVIIFLASSAIFLALYMITLNTRIALFCALCLPFIFWLILISIINKRRNAFTEQLSDCLTTVANALRAGYSFPQAVDIVSKEMEPPISVEFARVAYDVSMGINLDIALEQMARRVESADFDLVVTAVLIQRDIGGNLAQILDSISDTIIERIRMKREINALTAQGRLSALVLVLLPFFVASFMYVFNHDQFIILFDEPVGQMALGVSLLMDLLGVFVIKKIIDIEV